MMVDLLIREESDYDNYTLYIKAEPIASSSPVSLNGPLYKNKDIESFTKAVREYIDAQSDDITIDIDNKVKVDRFYYDCPHPKHGVHLCWYQFLNSNTKADDESKQVMSIITSRLKDAGIVFWPDCGVNEAMHVHYGSDGFVINQSLLECFPKELVTIDVKTRFIDLLGDYLKDD